MGHLSTPRASKDGATSCFTAANTFPLTSFNRQLSLEEHASNSLKGKNKSFLNIFPTYTFNSIAVKMQQINFPLPPYCLHTAFSGYFRLF